MMIRDAVEADLTAIVDIYNCSIPTRMATGDLQPISVESRKTWFQEHSPKTHPLWVMEKEGTIAGWLSFQYFYGRPAYAATAEVSIYISPDFRRQGVGKLLLQRAIDTSPQLGLKTLLAFIFAHNHPSLQLFTQHQFESWGHLPKIADLDGVERDLIIMGRTVIE